MWRSHLLLLSVLASSLWCGVHSQQLGPENCVANFTLDASDVVRNVPPGTVCIACVFGGVVATDAAFQIDNSNVDQDYGNGRVVFGVLVVFNTEDVFDVTSTDIRCSSAAVGGSAHTAIVFLQIFRAPVITGETVINEGGTLNLDCDSRNSRPGPSVEWFNPDGDSISNSRIVMMMDIQRNASGTYTCVANQEGATMSSSVNITVQFAPDVFADRMDLVDVPLGRELQISCSFLGIPPPDTVVWSHNSTALNLSDSRNTVVSTNTTSSLSRMNVVEDEGGVYACEVSNEVGSDAANTSVRIQLPPGPPTGLQVTGQTVASLTISWTNPTFDGFSSIASFRVRVIAVGNVVGFSRDFAGDASTTSYTLVALSPFTRFTLRLFVINEVELEGESAETTGMTDSLRLPVVESPSATTISSTEIRVTWQAPDFNPTTTAEVDNYRVTYTPANGGASVVLTVGANDTERSLTGLMMGTNYNITIVATNTAGDGNAVVLVQPTHIDPPTMPRDINATSTNPFTIVVTWAEPETDGGRPLNRYRVSLTGGVSPAVEVDVAVDIFSHTFDNLQQNTTYQITITVFNIDDKFERESPAAMTTENTLPVGEPRVPNPPTVSDITNTSATFTWNDPGGYPIEYILQVKKGHEDWTDASVVSDNTTDRTSTLSKLLPLITYEARVQSRNFNGLSDFSPVTRFNTFGRVMVSGPAQNETVTSGREILLTCTQQSEGRVVIEYTWTRVGGAPLPEGSEVNNGELLIAAAQERDSGVYICTANGVVGTFNLTIEDPPSDDGGGGGVSTNVIIIAASVGGGALIVFLVVVILAIYCLCFRGESGKSNHRRTLSFRPKHWTDASGSHSLPKDQQRKEVTNSFRMPDDYTSHTSFNTADRVRRSPSPPSHRAQTDTHAGAEPTTSFQLSVNTGL